MAKAKGVTATMIAQVVFRMEEGEKLSYIAKDVGLAHQSLCYHLKKLGYPTRIKFTPITREEVEAEIAKIRNGKYSEYWKSCRTNPDPITTQANHPQPSAQRP